MENARGCCNSLPSRRVRELLRESTPADANSWAARRQRNTLCLKQFSEQLHSRMTLAGGHCTICARLLRQVEPGPEALKCSGKGCGVLLVVAAAKQVSRRFQQQLLLQAGANWAHSVLLPSSCWHTAILVPKQLELNREATGCRLQPAATGCKLPAPRTRLAKLRLTLQGALRLTSTRLSQRPPWHGSPSCAS